MDRIDDRTVAGSAFLAGGAVIVLGFISAASLYPGYSVAEQTISARGATGAPPVATWVFNGSMVVAGMLTVLGGGALHHVHGNRGFTAVLVATAVGGYIGVGLFPAGTGVVHTLAAVIAFGGTGVAVVVTATVVKGPYAPVAAVLGTAELLAFAAFVTVGGATPLGVGGLERVVAYLGIVWALSFAGFLLGGSGRETAPGGS